MSDDFVDDNNKDQIIEFDLTYETKQDGFVTRIYRQGSLIFAVIQDKYPFFIEVNPGKLSEVAKRFRELVQRELPVLNKDLSKEDLMIIGRNISSEILNNIQKLQDLAYKKIRIEKSKSKKNVFSVEDIWDKEGKIDEHKLTADILLSLRASPVGLFANKVTKTKLDSNDLLLQDFKTFSESSDEERYKRYLKMDEAQFKNHAHVLYEAIVFRSSEMDKLEDGDKLTTDIADKDVKNDKSKEDATLKDIFLEDADRYNTKFVYFDDEVGEFKTVDYVIKNNKVIFPMPSAGTPAMPYEFYNLDYLNLFYKNEVDNKKTTVESLFKEMLAIVVYYNKVSLETAIVWAAAIVMTYMIDLFPVTPYFATIGIPGSGKTTKLITVKWTAYRSTSMTNPNAAQAVRLFGNVEPGQLTLIGDEADKIDKDDDFMAMIKNGNQKDGQHQKVNDNTKLLDYFYTYCPKFLGAEKAPAEWVSMGWYERTMISKSKKVHMNSTDPNVKDLMMDIGLSNQTKQMKMAILKWRKKAMLYRMTHYNEPIEQIDIGVGGRDKEIAYPILSLFYGTAYQRQITWAIQKALDEMNNIKRNSLSAIFCIKVARYLYEHRKEKLNTLRIKDFWESLREDDEFGTYMSDISGKKKWIESPDHGVITPDIIGIEFKNNFKTDGGKHTRMGKVWTFDLDVIITRLETYQIKSDRLKLSLMTEKDKGCDQSDWCDQFLESTAKDLLSKKMSQSGDINSDKEYLETKFEKLIELVESLEPELNLIN